MPKFIVEGARKETAEDCTLIIEAADAGKAEKTAGDQGVFVSSVTMMTSPRCESANLRNRAQDKPFTHRTDAAYIEWSRRPSDYNPIDELDCRPVCPYCTGDMKRDRPPTRRSKFSCPQCGRVVWADPWHGIFPSCYLTERQGIVAAYLGKLDSDVATAGRTEDFWWAAQQKDWLMGKTRLTDAEAADALWTLMNYNVAAMAQVILPEAASLGLKWHQDQLQILMRQFREELDHAKDSKSAKRNEGKKEVPCPYCHAALGQLAQPSRRGSRSCVTCGGLVIVDPKQPIFNTPFLTERQGFIADCHARISRFVFTKAKISDYRRKRKELGLAEDASDAALATVLRSLVEDNLAMVVAQAEKNAAKLRKELGDVLGESIAPDWTEAGMIRQLLEEFDTTWPRFLPDGRLSEENATPAA